MFASDRKTTIKTIWVLYLSILQYSYWLSNGMTFFESEWGRNRGQMP